MKNIFSKMATFNASALVELEDELEKVENDQRTWVLFHERRNSPPYLAAHHFLMRRIKRICQKVAPYFEMHEADLFQELASHRLERFPLYKYTDSFCGGPMYIIGYRTAYETHNKVDIQVDRFYLRKLFWRD